jgi:hypothetical protein
MGLKGLAFSVIAIFLLGCSKTAPQSERELVTRVLAEHVAKAVKPKSVLILSNPFSQSAGRSADASAFEKAGIAGLNEGFGDGIKISVGFPALKPEVLKDPTSVVVDAQTTTPLSFLVADNAFTEAASRHPDADVIVSLIGLPVNLGAFKEWQNAGKPQFALLLPDWRIIGGREAILQNYQSGKLIAAVVRKPNSGEGELTGNSRKDFEQRYLLVTRENVEQLISEQSALFGIR